MVSTNGAGNAAAAVTDRRLSTVVPAEVTGDSRVHELGNMDLAMKLHYLRMVHYFPAGGAAAGLTVPELKYPMFRLLEAYYLACGRIRRSESGGRPVIKCNDSGVRVVEARCEVALGEWLAAGEHRHVAADKVLGPDVHFSPPVVVQFTRFKCGGLALGFSWSHLLGDAVSAANFVHLYGQVLSGNPPPKTHHLQSPPARTEKPATASPAATTTEPLSTRQVKTVQDCWLPANELKLETFSFHVAGTQVKLLQSKISTRGRTPFEAISALVWQCLAKFRGSHREPRIVTICKANPSATRSWILSNEQVIGTVRADISPSQAELSQLANLIAEGFVDETRAIEAQVETETGGPDLMVYGANLTFVDLEEIEAYGLEVKGQAPVFVNYSIEGVGDEGAVLVFQGAKAAGEDRASGRTVNVILPGDEVLHLRKELEKDWGIA